MAEKVVRWVTPVDRTRLDDLEFKGVLAAIAADPDANGYLPFGKLSMVHFANIILCTHKSAPPANEPVPLVPPRLVFESNIDAPLKTYVEQLVEVGRTALDVLYQDLPDYPGPKASRKAVEEFFLRRKLRKGTHLYHIGHPDRTLQEIRGDFELRRSIENELDTDKKLRERSPSDIVREIRHRAKGPFLWFCQQRRPWNDKWADPIEEAVTPLDQITWKTDSWSFPMWLMRTAVLVWIALLVAFALIVLANPLIPPKSMIALVTLTVFVLVRSNSGEAPLLKSGLLSLGFGALLYGLFQWPVVSRSITSFPAKVAAWLILVLPMVLLMSYLPLMWRLMTRDPKPVPPWVKRAVPTLLEAEDREKNSHYNHVAGLSELKPTYRWLRAFRTQLVMELLNLFYRTQYLKGKLVTIPSIHFAQWSLVDNEYLLFLTNYDGPADSYLDDFFNNLAFGVAFIWHETVIFPDSVDPRRLKLWVREGQTLASVRYRNPVYDGLTVAAINNNTYIRTRLLTRRSASGARRWLRRFATIPEEPTVFTRVSGWFKELAAGVRG